MKLLKRRRRLDPQLVDQQAAGLLVYAQRFGLAARAVEGKHQLAPEPLPERILFREPFELTDELSGLAPVEIGLDPLFDRRCPQLLEAGDLSLGEGLEGEIGKRRATPQFESLAELGTPRLRLERASCGYELLEASEVDLTRRNVQLIARGLRDDDIGANHLPQLRDEVLERGRRSPRRPLSPEEVHESIGRDDTTRVQSENREDGALLLAADLDNSAVVLDFEAPEETEAQSSRGTQRSPLPLFIAPTA